MNTNYNHILNDFDNIISRHRMNPHRFELNEYDRRARLAKEAAAASWKPAVRKHITIKQRSGITNWNTVLRRDRVRYRSPGIDTTIANDPTWKHPSGLLDGRRAWLRAAQAGTKEFWSAADLVTDTENLYRDYEPSDYEPTALDLSGCGTERQELRTELAAAWSLQRYLRVRVDEGHAKIMRTGTNEFSIRNALEDPHYGLNETQRAQWISNAQLEEVKARLAEVEFTYNAKGNGADEKWVAPPMKTPQMEPLRSWLFSLLERDDIHTPVESALDLEYLDRFHNHSGQLRIAIVGPVTRHPEDEWSDTVSAKILDSQEEFIENRTWERRDLLAWKYRQEAFGFGMAPQHKVTGLWRSWPGRTEKAEIAATSKRNSEAIAARVTAARTAWKPRGLTLAKTTTFSRPN